MEYGAMAHRKFTENCVVLQLVLRPKQFDVSEPTFARTRHRMSTCNLCNAMFVLFAMIQVVSEEPVFESVMSWVRHDEETRCEHLPALLKYVRLPLLTAKYLTDHVDEEVNSRTFAPLPPQGLIYLPE